MKTIFVILVFFVFGLSAWFLIPLTQETIICYQTKQKNVDDIGFRTRASNWDERKVCEEKSDAIVRLDECLQMRGKKRNKQIMLVLDPYVNEVLRMIVPYVKGTVQQKEDYNADCGIYSDLLME
ncbi:hypothetical protein HY948_02525 [Candidatus Gottesmanbacteria bacterium]|nr:hypothetical protein [Candidatus Gottesmanbacteria bacterium]